MNALSMILVAVSFIGQENPDNQAPLPLPESVKGLYDKARPAVVFISVEGRTGESRGVGTGFIISPDGLVVTNRHVIGEGRGFSVQLANGKRIGVAAVHATSTKHDLAILKLEGADFPAIELGNSADVAPGEPVLAIGNPLGLAHSVVAGVVSAKREIDKMPMIQIAMPIEPGNSGGPLLDKEGRAVGVITMKSAITANLGFAIETDALKPLLENPNPVPIDRWRTIGALDPQRWETKMGSNWRQRAGRVTVSEPGNGFGGRSVCLSMIEPPKEPFEVTVAVRLSDESGAAGIAFASDGGDRHFGFYPSGGSLRLTRFDGPDVLSWTILADIPSDAYLPSEWNRLKVRLDRDSIRCYVNDDMVIQSRDTSFSGARLGLVKFRDTEASFRDFTIGPIHDDAAVAENAKDELAHMIAELPKGAAASDELAERFLNSPNQSIARLKAEARLREREAQTFKKLADRVHELGIRQAIEKEVAQPAGKIDLLKAALLIARLDNEEVDVDAYIAEVDRMADAIRKSFPQSANDDQKLATLNRYLFEEHGYHGSRGDFYNRSNSYINEVIDDREGIPITLSLIYMELAKRLGVNVAGIGFPGHFVVRHEPADGSKQLIDVFERARPLAEEEAQARLVEAGVQPAPADEYRVDERAILVRMLQNLLGIARSQRDLHGMRRYLDVVVAIDPDSWEARWQRGVILLETGERERAAQDARWLMEHPNDGLDEDAVHRLLDLATNPRQ